jgi:hypothetical protein
MAKIRYPEMTDRFDGGGLRRGQEREIQEAGKARNEQIERKLIREIEEEDRKAKIDPPPELSPAEVKERELAERITKLEGKQVPFDPSTLNRKVESSEQHRRKDALRMLRIRKDNEEQAARNQAHLKRCGKQIKQLEKEIADVEVEQRTEEERHQQVLGELNGTHAALADKLARLNTSLGPDESTEGRLRALELT